MASFNRQSVVGQTFSRLTVLATEKSKASVSCVCGVFKDVDLWALKAGRIKSCGCFNKEQSARNITKYNNKSRPAHVTDEWLREEYLGKKRSASDIARELGYSLGHPLKWLREAGIKARDRRESTQTSGYLSRNSGRAHGNYKHGRRVLGASAYKIITLTDEERQSPHRSDARGRLCEHIFVMENHIKRALTEAEIVHHINRNKLDNRIENLILFPNQTEHLRFHDYVEKVGACFLGLGQHPGEFVFHPDVVIPNPAAISNMRTRIGELETKLQAYGLLN